MPTDEKIDKEVDKIISKSQIIDNEIDEIKKRRPRFFNIFTASTKEDKKNELTTENEAFTVMKVSKEARIGVDAGMIANLTNTEKIDDLIKKHEEFGKQRKNSSHKNFF